MADMATGGAADADLGIITMSIIITAMAAPAGIITDRTARVDADLLLVPDNLPGRSLPDVILLISPLEALIALALPLASARPVKIPAVLLEAV